MITIKDYMEAIEYKITSGTEFTWQCFGYNARYLDSERPGYSVSIVFDTDTHVVYLAEVCDYSNSRSYRLFNPEHKAKYVNDAKSRGIDLANELEDIQIIDLEVDDDWLEKASAIVRGKEYDVRVMITLDLNDDEILKLCIMAHNEDMTLNDFIHKILSAQVERLQKGVISNG